MATPGWYPDPSGQPQTFRYWDGQSWSEQTTSDPSSPPPAPPGYGTPPAAAPTQLPGQYPSQDPYGQDPYGQQGQGYGQSQPDQYGGYGGYGGGGYDPYAQSGYQGGTGGGGTGKRIGFIALAVLLIAGLAVGGFFGVRALTDDDDTGGSASDDNTSQTEDTDETEETDDTESPTDETESPTDEPTDSPTQSGPTGQECTGGLPTIGGEMGKRGRINGGDLELSRVDGFEPVEQQIISTFTFADEVAATSKLIEEGWIAMYAVGALPKANGYTDLAASADQVITCMSESPNFYQNFTGREDLESEEIEVDGSPAYSITSEIRVDSPQLNVEGDVAKVIVVDTGDEEHFGLYISVVPIGDQQMIDEQETVSDRLKVDD